MSNAWYDTPMTVNELTLTYIYIMTFKLEGDLDIRKMQ